MKKLISFVLALSIVFSLFCVCGSAETTIELNDGVKLVMYDDDEVAPFLKARASSTTFSINPVALYSSSSYAGEVTIPSGKTNIGIQFTTKTVERFYIALYDATSEKYITSGTNGLYGPIISDTFSFTGLTARHTYEIYFSSSTTNSSMAGTIYTY